MAGDYYNSSEENAANRAKVSPSLLGQIFDAIAGLAKDVVTPKKYQDRGSADPVTTDILHLNSPSTPPAAAQFNVPENPEIRHSEQHNEKQFRFLGLNTGQAGNKHVDVPIFGVPLSPNHTPMTKERFPHLHELLYGLSRDKAKGLQQTIMGKVSGKRVLDQAQVTADGSGASAPGGGAPSGGGGAPSGGGGAPSGGSGGRYGRPFVS